MSDGVLIGLQAALPGIDVGVNFLSPGDDADKVSHVIADVLRSPHPEGFILVRASLGVQRLIQSVGLPAVVYGSLYPSVHNLSWIDFDQRQSSRLLVERILEQGHRRVLYLGRDRVFPGDYLFQDSMIETLAEAGLPMSALTIRHLPADHELIKTEVCALLGRGCAPSAPTNPVASGMGIIARTEPLANGAVAAVESMGMVVGRDVTVTAATVYRVGGERPLRYPHIRSAVDPRIIGEHIGRLLANQAIGQAVSPEHEVVPVVLREAAT